MIVHHLIHLILLVNIKLFKKYVLNSIYLYSEEETDTDDDDIIAQILRSNESLSRYEQMNSYFFDNRNSTAVSYQTNDIYNSSTQLDPFARSLNPSDRHHYEKQPTIQKYAFYF
jgi:hypothetical protein